MPQHKSAEKRIRQGARRAERNKASLSTMKTLVKPAAKVDDELEASAARLHLVGLESASSEGVQ